MKKILLMFFMAVIAFTLVGCKTKNKYTDEEHIKNVSKIIEEKYLKNDITYKLRPLYDKNDKLSYFVVDFSNDTYFYIKIQEKDLSAFFGQSLYTKDTADNNSGPWQKYKVIEEDGTFVKQWEKDENGNNIYYYNSHFEVANIDTNTKCYLIDDSFNRLYPAIKIGNEYLNLITGSTDIITSDEYLMFISFLAGASFNL